MQFELDALIWPMFYIYCNSEILIIDLKINFCELYLFADLQKIHFREKPLNHSSLDFSVTETRHFNVLSLLFVTNLF